MKNLKQIVVDRATKIIEQLGDTEFLGWPPDCLGLFYQPERPFVDELTNDLINED